MKSQNKALELQIESLTGQANPDRDVLSHTREMNAVLLPKANTTYWTDIPELPPECELTLANYNLDNCH
jgi:hypothetical protein